MKLAFKIALRFLKSNIAQTVLIILGIAVAVSVQIFIGALIQGLQKGLVEKTIGNSSQITVYSDTAEKTITDYEDLILRLKSDYPELTAISATSDTSALMEYEDQTQSLLIRGMDETDSSGIYEWSQRITEGSYPDGANEVLLGTDLSEEYGLKVGDAFTLVTRTGDRIELTISGFFDLKVSTVNKTWAITTMENTQTIFSTENVATSIEMQVSEGDLFAADTIGNTITEDIKDDNLYADNWKDANEQLLSGLQGQSVSSYMIQVFVMISVVLGISSVLAITVLQKSRQIGILKAMGLKNRTTSIVFLSQGLVLGVLGAIGGIALGLGLGYSFSEFVRNSDGTPVVALYINSTFIIASGCIAVFAALFASLIPALKSRKLNPIDIIRNN